MTSTSTLVHALPERYVVGEVPPKRRRLEWTAGGAAFAACLLSALVRHALPGAAWLDEDAAVRELADHFSQVLK